ncbi:oxidoreductase [Bryobacterales bacterium F-183]|nr:oxidoreductase [Bryobacterales bacterium F-183]
MAETISFRTLGSTGERVSCIGLGGSHVGDSKLSDREAKNIIRTAIESGITFLDNSWDYHKGRSEELVGSVLKENPAYRERAFVMTKIDGRTEKEAEKQINQSLKRLGVDYLDLLQHHEVIRFDDVDRIFEEDGATAAFDKAKEDGKIRYTGFTGHKDPHIHLYMLEQADRHDVHFDAVQMPLNVMDCHFRSFEKLVLPELLRRKIGVLGMKSMAYGVILKSNTVTAEECLRYTLSLPISVLITGIDSEKILDQAIRIATDFTPLSPEEMEALRAKTRHAGAHGEFELFKTSSRFDATAENPEWLGELSERVEALAGN